MMDYSEYLMQQRGHTVVSGTGVLILYDERIDVLQSTPVHRRTRQKRHELTAVKSKTGIPGGSGRRARIGFSENTGCRIKYLLQTAPAVKTLKQILFRLGIPGRLVAQHGKPPLTQHDVLLTVQ